MQFTTSDGRVFFEDEIQISVLIIIRDLYKNGERVLTFREKEFLEWFLEKEIVSEKIIDYRNKITYFKTKLNQNITQNDLKQLKQLEEFLRL